MMRTISGALIICCLAGSASVSGEETKAAKLAPVSLVSNDRLLRASEEPRNWLMYSGQYNGQRFSRLDRLNRDNVDQLRLKWVRQFPTQIFIECSPLVVDGVMYITLPENKVWAMDARTGLRYWKYEHELPDKLAACCGKVNRGVAIHGETLFMGTLDCHLVALDARSGNVKWDVEVAPGKDGHSITSAPLVVKDMVITGVAGGEYGIRGFLDAYDMETGKLRWRKHTIPEPGEPGHETWPKDSAAWKIGGAPTWLTGAYDPQLDLLYWGVGNPGPDWNGEVRKGDNLYSDCVLALDPDDGKLVWHFQFTPWDVHDWDACQIPVLVDTKYEGCDRKLLLWANRNAFYYVLDRTDGEFLAGTPYAKQTWAEEKLTKKGRPIRLPNTLPSKEGTTVSPDVGGATNWWSPSYSPRTNLFYVNAFDGDAQYFIGEAEYEKGQQYLGGFGESNEFLEFPDPRFKSAIRALEPTTGKLRWEYEMMPKSTAGILSTAGDLVFSGTSKGNFFALDAESGKELWRLSLGAKVHAAPVTYMVGDQQFVTIAAGNAFFTFGL